MDATGCIGVFDSGVGGVSVLKALAAELPHEDFIYFGDSANAPYGERSQDEILSLTRAGVELLLERGAKAVVIACNTATSVAAKQLRSTYAQVPIVGVEPALKPAVEAYPGGTVLVMATPVTLALDKYQELAASLDDKARVISAPCPGLAGRIEEGRLADPDIVELIRELVGGYAGEADAVVLGCTHYPFVAAQIREVLGDVELFEGGVGTARQTRRVLEAAGLLNAQSAKGTVQFLSSQTRPGGTELMQRLFAQDLAGLR